MFEKYLNMIGPPVEVARESDLAALEMTRHVRFPHDFKAWLQFFGSGIVDDFIYIWNPISRVGGLNFYSEMDRTINAFRKLIASEPESYSGWRLYPSAGGGLLPCGHTGNSDVICWVTNGDNPDRWSIAVYGGEPSLWSFKENLTTFIQNCLTHPNYCEPFGDMTGSKHTFRPLPETIPTSSLP